LISISLKEYEVIFSSIIESLVTIDKIMDKMDIIIIYLLNLSEEYSSFTQEINIDLSLNMIFNQIKG
jgi:hypothetical protein